MSYNEPNPYKCIFSIARFAIIASQKKIIADVDCEWS